MTTPQGDPADRYDPSIRGLVRDLETAVRTAAAEAVARGLDDVRGAIATMDARDAEARDALAAAALGLPDRLAPLVEGVVRQALRDERGAFSEAAERGFSNAAHRLDAAVRTAADQARVAAAAGGGLDQAMLARTVEDWRAQLGEALAGVMVPYAGGLSKIGAQLQGVDAQLQGVDARLGTQAEGVRAIGEGVGAIAQGMDAVSGGLGSLGERVGAVDAGVARVDERLGDVEALLRMQGDAIAALGRKLDAAKPGGGAAIAAELEAAIAPLAAAQQAAADRAEARAGVADIGIKAMRTHIKAATRAEKEHAEKLAGVSRHVEGIAGRLAFTVEALSGHAMLIERLRTAARMQNVLAIANFVAALLVFVAVFLDRFWYLLR